MTSMRAKRRFAKRNRFTPTKDKFALAMLVLSPLSAPLSSHALSITTFNILAPVHRSIGRYRESDCVDWWRPRAEYVAEYCASNFQASDVVLLQEWWFHQDFEEIFDYYVSPYFDRIAERRPDREDGLAVLVRKQGRLEFQASKPVLTGPQRIAQVVNCREKTGDERIVVIGNVHLSFPSSPDMDVNHRRQACEVQKVVRALSRERSAHLQLLGGDFNCNSNGLAARFIESPDHGFVNCASAAAAQAMCDVGGQVHLGITHRTHNGDDVSVDHIFAKSAKPQHGAFLQKLGYLDKLGTRVVGCHRGDFELDKCVISDHRPVTATLEWPSKPTIVKNMMSFCSIPLDPLEPPSYLGQNLTMIGQD